jgi:hypothetical protein
MSATRWNSATLHSWHTIFFTFLLCCGVLLFCNVLVVYFYVFLLCLYIYAGLIFGVCAVSQTCNETNVHSLLFSSCVVLLLCRIASVRRDSSVAIATGYGLDGPGIESRWGTRFSVHIETALGPTQPAVHWVPGFFPGRKDAEVWRWPPAHL